MNKHVRNTVLTSVIEYFVKILHKYIIASLTYNFLFSVNDRYVTEKSTIDGRSICASSHWDENVKIYYLSEKMRSQDSHFNEICDRVGEGIITKEDEQFFQSRVESTELEMDNELFKEGRLSIVVTTNKNRDQINMEKLNTLLPNERTYVCQCLDRTINVANVATLDKNIPYTQTGGLPGELHIKIGAPIVITANHKKRRFKEDGLMNGARGYIEHIKVCETNPDVVSIIWIVFNNKQYGREYRASPEHLKLRRDQNLSEFATPILPSKKSFKYQRGNIEYQRTQFSLTLGYAVTVHKVNFFFIFQTKAEHMPFLVEPSPPWVQLVLS